MTPRMSVALHPASHLRPVEIRAGGLGRAARVLHLTIHEALCLRLLLEDALNPTADVQPGSGARIPEFQPATLGPAPHQAAEPRGEQ